MLDNILNAVRRSAGTVQKRGEEVAQGARLRLEIYQLSRELDGLYARLGRAYHAGTDQAMLDDLSAEVARLDEEIAAREALAAELGESKAAEPLGHAQAVQQAAARTRPASSTGVVGADIVRTGIVDTDTGSADTLGPDAVNNSDAVDNSGAVNTDTTNTDAAEPNLGDLPDLSASVRRPVPGSDAPRVARSNVMQPATPLPAPSNAPSFVKRPDDTALASSPGTIASTGSPPAPAASRIWRAKENERMTDPKESKPVNPSGPLHEPTLEDTGKNIPNKERTDEFGGLGDEAGRDKLYRHPNTLKEGELATEHPDPLEK